jgi:hypothetical protein
MKSRRGSSNSRIQSRCPMDARHAARRRNLHHRAFENGSLTVLEIVRQGYQCPVCGFPDLWEIPRRGPNNGSFEICPSCGFQFGVSADDRGITDAAWRAEWIANGMKWQGKGYTHPTTGTQLRGFRENKGTCGPRGDNPRTYRDQPQASRTLAAKTE